ncbi:MAG: hemolysin-coregulated protein [Gammaproteobacteria bacterium]|nr:MAG: hemolysin-coregulated protein [Gammaproteobacteria bacterium]
MFKKTTQPHKEENTMSVYMEYEGIEGNVTMEGYEGQIELQNFSWNVGRGISMITGRTSNREASSPNVGEVCVSKIMDKSTPLLVQESVIGTKGKKVIIHLTRTGGDAEEEYMTYTLHDCLISSYSVSSGENTDTSETLSLSFTGIETAYSESGKDNVKGGQGRFGYSVEKGKKM